MTSTSRHSASRCLRMTAVASWRPSSESCRCRSPSTRSRPSRSMRATVWLTVGPLWCSRSAMRARSGTIPSSSSSKIVRRYISVVSMRSFTGTPPCRTQILRTSATGTAFPTGWSARRSPLRPAGSVAGSPAAVRGGLMSDAVTVVWDEALLGYTMGGEHPLHPVRLDLTMRLADSLGVLAGDRIDLLRPTPADESLLTLVHDPAYLEAVRRAPADPGVGHGLGTADNPIFEGMRSE